MARAGVWTRLQLLAVRVPRPTKAGWTALAVSVLAAGMAADNGYNLALIAAALAMGLTLAGILLPAFLVRELRVTRNLPRRAMAGADLPVTVKVEATGRRGEGAVDHGLRDVTHLVERFVDRGRQLRLRRQLRRAQPVVAHHPLLVGVGDRAALERFS